LGLVLMTATIWPGAGCSYNKFTTQEEAIKAQWSEVDNQLQRRNDLIPNLVETVKGFAAQEQTVMKDVTDARAKMAGAATPADKIAAANAESSALSRLLVVVENYPNLKSDAQFMRLQDELAGTENRLATARMRYNEAVQAYQTATKKFPGNITAKMFGFKEHPYWDVPDAAKGVPKVDFGRGRGGM
jgi:LemA protein